ncbi:MAG: DUF2330 domain-containing protein [Sandaracinaceae bacterium]|nr:DUF2330 domain-containing protein [Sandaracinaceae bacterium]
MPARHLALALALAGLLDARPAAACGGFFCSQSPVDQRAERIVFAIDEEAGTTDMIVQIQYAGRADDFAWVVPLGAVPLDGSLATFPQAAMVALDAGTAPAFAPSRDCVARAGGEELAEPSPVGLGVDVHVREVVGPYDTAVVSSEDPGALVEWLRANGFRVTAAMEPYVAMYTREGSVFLALRLTGESDVEDIAPLRMTLPGTAPGIPLRMTAIAAEPEMGIVVTILGSQRYEAANWPNVEVPPSELAVEVVEEPWSVRFNWAAAVARAVDRAGGRGWVTETASPTAPYVDRLRATTPADDAQAEAIEALLALFGGRLYLSRLYTRVSPEEMISDPIFRRSAGGDVLFHVGDFLTDACELPEADPCAFMACGAGGRCAVAAGEAGGRLRLRARCDRARGDGPGRPRHGVVRRPPHVLRLSRRSRDARRAEAAGPVRRLRLRHGQLRQRQHDADVRVRSRRGRRRVVRRGG